jgi:hypothetical protein
VVVLGGKEGLGGGRGGGGGVLIFLHSPEIDYLGEVMGVMAILAT